MRNPLTLILRNQNKMDESTIANNMNNTNQTNLWSLPRRPALYRRSNLPTISTELQPDSMPDEPTSPTSILLADTADLPESIRSRSLGISYKHRMARNGERPMCLIGSPLQDAPLDEIEFEAQKMQGDDIVAREGAGGSGESAEVLNARQEAVGEEIESARTLSSESDDTDDEDSDDDDKDSDNEGGDSDSDDDSDDDSDSEGDGDGDPLGLRPLPPPRTQWRLTMRNSSRQRRSYVLPQMSKQNPSRVLLNARVDLLDYMHQKKSAGRQNLTKHELRALKSTYQTLSSHTLVDGSLVPRVEGVACQDLAPVTEPIRKSRAKSTRAFSGRKHASPVSHPVEILRSKLALGVEMAMERHVYTEDTDESDGGVKLNGEDSDDGMEETSDDGDMPTKLEKDFDLDAIAAEIDSIDEFADELTESDLGEDIEIEDKGEYDADDEDEGEVDAKVKKVEEIEDESKYDADDEDEGEIDAKVEKVEEIEDQSKYDADDEDDQDIDDVDISADCAKDNALLDAIDLMFPPLNLDMIDALGENYWSDTSRFEDLDDDENDQDTASNS